MGGRSTYGRLEFPDLWDDIVAHEQNSDTREFGKGALSANSSILAVLRSCGVAVGKGKEVRG